METKWIQHPMLPDGQEVEVPAQSVGHYAHSGWIVMDEPPAWSTVRPEDDAMAALQDVARKAAQMPEAPDKTSDSSSAPGNDESGDEPDDKEQPTGKRSRRAPTKEG